MNTSTLPRLADLAVDTDTNAGLTGVDLFGLCETLYPLARSLTGEGVLQTLSVLQQALGLVSGDSTGSDHPVFQTHAIASGTPVFDWQVPQEWQVRSAWLKAPDGRVIADFAKHNLHLMGYSEPVQTSMSLQELQPHLHSLPNHPDWIPYRTSYYAPAWGFCLTDRERRTLRDGQYQVHIDTTLTDGRMHWGEVLIPGQSEREILVSTHLCHPSMANDNLSGIAVAAGLVDQLNRQWQAGQRPRLSYRFIFIPATIGAITWLATNQARLDRIEHTLVLSNMGDAGRFHYKSSPDGNSAMDQAFELIQRNDERFSDLTMLDFSPYGYDERQFNSPGIALNAGSLMRTPFGQYPQYHTSADNLRFISARSLNESVLLCQTLFNTLQANTTYRSLNPMCEPQLGRRGLYQNVGGNNQNAQRQLAMLWILNQANGKQSMLDIAQRSGINTDLLAQVANDLINANLLETVDEPR